MQFRGNLPLLSNITDTTNSPKVHTPNDMGIKNNTRIVVASVSSERESLLGYTGIKNNTRAVVERSDNNLPRHGVFYPSRGDAPPPAQPFSNKLLNSPRRFSITKYFSYLCPIIDNN